MLRILTALGLVLLLTGCMSGGGDTLPPPDWSGGQHEPVPIPDPHDGSGDPDGGGTPTDPVLKIGVLTGQYNVYQDDAARIMHLAVLDKADSIVSVLTLTRQNQTGMFRLEELPLGEVRLAFVEYDAAWGSAPEVMWRSDPITLTEAVPIVSDLHINPTSVDYVSLRYRMLPVHMEQIPAEGSLALGYRIVGDPRNRVRLTRLGSTNFARYTGDGLPFDYNNDGSILEPTYPAPKGANVILGWYEIVAPPDFLQDQWTIGQLLPIQEYGPVVIEADMQPFDLTLDFSKRGTPIGTR